MEASEDEELTGADEDVATTADAITGNVAVGAKLRTTTGLNLRAGAGTNFAILVTMPAGATVTVRQSAPVRGWYAITYGTRAGWASGAYLVAASGGGGAPAPSKTVRISGPAVRGHVQSFANAACSNVGCPYEIGTRVGHDPSADRAIDMMMSPIGTRPRDGGAHGSRVAQYSLDHARTYKVLYTIWNQRINTLDGRGWRFMADRGSITQNHYDHVHVSFHP